MSTPPNTPLAERSYLFQDIEEGPDPFELNDSFYREDEKKVYGGKKQRNLENLENECPNDGKRKHKTKPKEVLWEDEEQMKKKEKQKKKNAAKKKKVARKETDEEEEKYAALRAKFEALENYKLEII